MNKYSKKKLLEIENDSYLLHKYIEDLILVWEKNSCLDNTITLIGELWYILISWEFVAKEKLEYDMLKAKLKYVCKRGIDNFIDNYRFLLLVGYMQRLFTDVFSDNDKEFIYTETNGLLMLKKAYQLNKNDVSKYRLISAQESTPEIEDECKNLRKKITNKNVDIEVVDKVIDYVKASLNPKVPSGHENKVKSKLYDVEYSK